MLPKKFDRWDPNEHSITKKKAALSVKKSCKQSGLEAVVDVDADLEPLIDQDKLLHENDARRLKLEKHKLALQEKQFERGWEEHCATTELLSALIESLNSKKQRYISA